MSSINDFFTSLGQTSEHKTYLDIDEPSSKDKLNIESDDLYEKISSLKSKVSRKRQTIKQSSDDASLVSFVKEIPINSERFLTFSDLEYLDKSVLKNLLDNGIQLPTPTQLKAIPALCSGNNFVITAPTGSGKTLSYLIPAFCHLKINNFETKILIISPTRELSIQIHEKCIEFAPNIVSTVLVGGVDFKSQISSINNNSKIVVGTPGRIVDIASKKRLNIPDFSLVILDEADRLLDSGFSEQLNLIFSAIRSEAQIAAFSATFPDFLEVFMAEICENFEKVEIYSAKKIAPNLAQHIHIFQNYDKKLLYLKEYIKSIGDSQLLIFCENNQSCDFLSLQLNDSGLDSRSLHANHDQLDRISTIKSFKNGEFDILVCTSLASRGLDIVTLKYVVNFDPPNHREEMIHRSGRCGRGGRVGDVTTLVLEEEGFYLPFLVELFDDSSIDVSQEIRNLAKKYETSSKSFNYDGFTETKGFNFDLKETLNSAIKAGKIEDLPLISKNPNVFPINNLPLQVRNSVTRSDFLSQIALKHDIILEVKGSYQNRKNSSKDEQLYISLKGEEEDCLSAKMDIQREINSLMADKTMSFMN